MWKIKSSLNNKILKYFLLFSILILVVLWLLQFLFFNYFYKEQKLSDIKLVSSKLLNYNDNNYEDTINRLAFDKSVCIEIINADLNTIYSSTYFGKGCISNIKTTYKYKFDFLKSNTNEKTYEVVNTMFNNKTLVHAVRINNNNYAFINASLDPVDGTISLLKKQLIIISILVLVLSFVLAYFISNHISKPIKDMSDRAKFLATGNFNIDFKDSNIEEIDELANTLNYAKYELSKTDELRRDLMANVSHDLKTPLTMIKANAEITKDLHINNKDKIKEDMDTIISETDRLTILVNDILTLSKMESVNDELNIEEFNLIDLIKNILDKYKILQETEKYTFKFIHKDKKLLVKADKKKIEAVIYNLINNAINYTGDDNLVTIKVTDNENILVEIIDTGKGIAKEDIKYIWNKYYKNKKKHKRNLIGTGLGLNIVKNILEEHNFKYGVNSIENKGTTFYFEIKKED